MEALLEEMGPEVPHVLPVVAVAAGGVDEALGLAAGILHLHISFGHHFEGKTSETP